jgi:hypothetical protein
MKHAAQSDSMLVENARRLVADARKIRWLMLVFAVVFFVTLGYWHISGTRKIEETSDGPYKSGFAFGVVFTIGYMTLSLGGAAFLAKFLTGFARDFRPFQLLVSYHDRLRELGQLPDDPNG